MNEWISVKDDYVPESGLWVLGLVKQDGDLWPMVVYRSGNGWWNAHDPSAEDRLYAQEVVYWRPLPLSPKEN